MFLESQNPFHGSKKNNHFHDLSGDVDDVDVRFQEGKHGKHPNIINSTMKSRFPKWKGMPWTPTGAHGSPPGPWSPIASVHLPGGPGQIAQKNQGVLQWKQGIVANWDEHPAIVAWILDTTWYYPLEASSKASTTKYGIPSFADRQSSRHDVSWRDVTVTWQNVSSYSKVAVPSKSQKLHWSRPRAQKKSGPKSWQVMARSRNRRFLGQYCDTLW